MAILLGIDTGGTYTDSVLIDTQQKQILAKSKTLTTYENLSTCIEESLDKLGNISNYQISRAVLSTTLATNAIMENKGGTVGLLLIGHDISKPLPCRYKKLLKGRIDYRGNITEPVDKQQIVDSALKMKPYIDALVISSVMSTRNPNLELTAKRTAAELIGHVYCAHTVSNHLGYYQRTITAVLNAQIMDIMKNFIDSVVKVFRSKHLCCPIYIMKSDGSLIPPECAVKRPIETMFSGPAASITGAVHLSGMNSCIVIDMGGTTSDIGIVSNKKIPILQDGAKIGSWKTHIQSLDLSTVALGGDSKIKYQNGEIVIGPEKVIPACRSHLPIDFTPTDILHCKNEYIQWSREKSLLALGYQADAAKLSKEKFLKKAEEGVLAKIKREFPLSYTDRNSPIVAVGAPARTWLSKAAELWKFPLSVPQHFEVANAVGAAVATVYQTLDALVRFSSQACCFVLYCNEQEPEFYSEKENAVEAAVTILKKKAQQIIVAEKIQKAKTEYQITEKSLSNCNDKSASYLETCIQVIIKGSF